MPRSPKGLPHASRAEPGLHHPCRLLPQPRHSQALAVRLKAPRNGSARQRPRFARRVHSRQPADSLRRGDHGERSLYPSWRSAGRPTHSGRTLPPLPRRCSPTLALPKERSPRGVHRSALGAASRRGVRGRPSCPPSSSSGLHGQRRSRQLPPGWHTSNGGTGGRRPTQIFFPGRGGYAGSTGPPPSGGDRPAGSERRSEAETLGGGGSLALSIDIGLSLSS
jgi:hypothetical protein